MRGLYLSVACIFMAAIMAVMLGGCTEGTGGIASGATGGTSETSMSNDEVKEIFENVLNRALVVESRICNGYGGFSVEFDKTIPNNPDYSQVSDPEFKCTDDIRKYINETYTPECAKDFDFILDQANPKFKDYEGQLYILNTGEGKGFNNQYQIDSLSIKKQEKGLLELEIPVILPGSELNSVFVIKKIGGLWLLDCSLSDAIVFE